MTYEESVRFLFSLGPELKTVKWDLERIRLLLEALGSPHRQGRFVHVAGTNGKGSTCAMIESVLRAEGRGTGLYTSPHLCSPRERIRVGGEMISEEAWAGAFAEVHRASEHLLAKGAIEAHPSFFETVTAMAFLAFARADVEIVVLETGLGGRLDATNVVEPEVIAITPIDFDHEAFLGSSIESIAAEKAGILKRGRPAVFATQRPDAQAVLGRRALELNVPVLSLPRVEELVEERFGSRFVLADDEAVDIACPLAGAHQVENARTAFAVLRRLGASGAAIREGMARARWAGRLERVAANPDLIVDGAHNPAGARALAAYIGRFFADEPIRLIYGAMRDKAVEEVTGVLFPLAAEVIVTAIDQPRALSPEVLAEMTDHPRLLRAGSARDALGMIREKPMTTFVAGSLFLAGEILGELAADGIRKG